jgi:hypothetical protein
MIKVLIMTIYLLSGGVVPLEGVKRYSPIFDLIAYGMENSSSRYTKGIFINYVPRDMNGASVAHHLSVLRIYRCHQMHIKLLPWENHRFRGGSVADIYFIFDVGFGFSVKNFPEPSYPDDKSGRASMILYTNYEPARFFCGPVFDLLKFEREVRPKLGLVAREGDLNGLFGRFSSLSRGLICPNHQIKRGRYQKRADANEDGLPARPELHAPRSALHAPLRANIPLLAIVGILLNFAAGLLIGTGLDYSRYENRRRYLLIGAAVGLFGIIFWMVGLPMAR